MFCGRCGNQLPGGIGNFCNKCGAPLPAPLAMRPAPVRKGRALPWILVGLLLAGGGAAAAYVLLVRGAATAKGPPPVVGVADTENLPPQVTSFAARASRVEAGGSTELTATIEDPERDPYYAWWTASCGTIAPRADEPARALFLAPSTPGPCAITLEVQDHELRRPRRLLYTIVVAGGGA